MKSQAVERVVDPSLRPDASLEAPSIAGPGGLADASPEGAPVVRALRGCARGADVTPPRMVEVGGITLFAMGEFGIVHHVTERVHAEAIAREGFLGGWGDCGFGVYFYTAVSDAAAYAKRGGWDGALEDPVVVTSLVPLKALRAPDLHPDWNPASYENVLWAPMDEDDEASVLVPGAARSWDLLAGGEPPSAEILALAAAEQGDALAGPQADLAATASVGKDPLVGANERRGLEGAFNREPCLEGPRSITAWHGTLREFEVFDPAKGDMGTHFGSFEQANCFRRHEKKGPDAAKFRMIPATLDLRNPIRLQDHGFEWNAWDVWAQALKTGQVQDPGGHIMADIRGALPDESLAQQVCRDALMAAGYDGIVYLNRAEGLPEDEYFALEREDDGTLSDERVLEFAPHAHDSYIVFRADQITIEPQRLIETPAFKAWFGESQVVDDQGLPLVVHHGGSFDELQDPVPAVGPQGFHFGTARAAQEREYGKLVDDFMLDLKVEQDESNGRWYWTSLGEDSGEILAEEGFETEEKARISGELYATTYADGMIQGQEEQPVTQAYLRILNPKRVEDQKDDWTAAVARAKAEGHDGLVYRNGYEDKNSFSWVVFEATQIKSVNNRGVFDPNNPDIRA